MTEPDKHLGKPDFQRSVDERADRLTEAAEWIWDHLVPHPIRTALEAYDDAHLVGDVPEEED
jgi:hypothetical protein